MECHARASIESLAFVENVIRVNRLILGLCVMLAPLGLDAEQAVKGFECVVGVVGVFIFCHDVYLSGAAVGMRCKVLMSTRIRPGLGVVVAVRLMTTTIPPPITNVVRATIARIAFSDAGRRA